MRLRYDMTALTHTGKVREANEDSVRIVPALNLAVVADGMGGHNAGEVAGGMAVEVLCDFFEARFGASDAGSGDVLAEAFHHSNREVYAASRKLDGCEGMGTTLLAAAFDDDGVRVGHIGDCRLYRFGGGKLESLTTDHTLAAAMLVENPRVRPPDYSHHLLQKALGLDSSCEPDFFTAPTTAGESYLLCSDGLCGVIEDGETAAILSAHSGRPEACADALVGACLERGAPDNVSVILVLVRE